MRTISLRLDAESDGMLRTLCDRLDATQTDVVRRALELLASSAISTPGALGLECGLVGGFASGTRSTAVGHSAAVKARLAAARANERPVVAVEHPPSRANRRNRTPSAPKP